MPYPKDHKTKSKNRILNCAAELFSRYGFEKVSISQIMQSAKLTHGAFYAHFESKEALFKESFIEPLKQSRAARLIKGPLSVKHLTELVSHYWNLRELEKNGKPGPENVLFNEVGSSNIQVRNLFEQSYNNLKKMVETRLLALSKLKQISCKPDRAAVAENARVIISLLVGAVVTAKTLTDKDEQNKILEAAQSQILQMLGAWTPTWNEQS